LTGRLNEYQVIGRHLPTETPHADLCTKHSRCQVKVLVLFDEIEEGKEVQWGDHHHQLGT